ncbi:MAG: hypothetical protein JO048_09285 [Methylobacteriaceae bacterium]|nr:hypothetical protein [Methylobacteriaceae bacterium]
MTDWGSYVWFLGLLLVILLPTLAYIRAMSRRQRPGGDPNHAWKQAAAETGHPEIADPDRR